MIKLTSQIDDTPVWVNYMHVSSVTKTSHGTLVVLVASCERRGIYFVTETPEYIVDMIDNSIHLMQPK